MIKELFFKVNAQGVIQKVYFDTEKKIGVHSHSVFSLYENDYETKLKSAILNHNDFQHFDFSHGNENFFVYLYITSSYFYAYIINQKPSDLSLKLINHLLELKANEGEINVNSENIESNGFFDYMQKLNNELINKGRQIEKMNQQLNQLNVILNNRLVADPLTDLVSRYQYQDEMILAINKYIDKKSLFCFIDIDNFKRINDTYGHHIGDLYLVEFSNRLKKLPFENCIKMRIAGDEFGLFIYGLDHVDKSMTNDIWNTFKSYLIKPIEIDGHQIPLSLSIGMSLYPKDTTDIRSLIAYADDAMYIAKKAGKNRFALYSEKK
ncbi:MAG: GGDEF domain-containing protein [Acholeplasmataceae bacterium]|nr:GGDEF domain-containing protein [Acholeplasmataceae bacterium]